MEQTGIPASAVEDEGQVKNEAQEKARNILQSAHEKIKIFSPEVIPTIATEIVKAHHYPVETEYFFDACKKLNNLTPTEYAALLAESNPQFSFDFPEDLRHDLDNSAEMQGALNNSSLSISRQDARTIDFINIYIKKHPEIKGEGELTAKKLFMGVGSEVVKTARLETATPKPEQIPTDIETTLLQAKADLEKDREDLENETRLHIEESEARQVDIRRQLEELRKEHENLPSNLTDPTHELAVKVMKAREEAAQGYVAKAFNFENFGPSFNELPNTEKERLYALGTDELFKEILRIRTENISEAEKKILAEMTEKKSTYEQHRSDLETEQKSFSENQGENPPEVAEQKAVFDEKMEAIKKEFQVRYNSLQQEAAERRKVLEELKAQQEAKLAQSKADSEKKIAEKQAALDENRRIDKQVLDQLEKDYQTKVVEFDTLATELSSVRTITDPAEKIAAYEAVNAKIAQLRQ